MKPDIRQVNLKTLDLFFRNNKAPAFRTQQLWQWLWQRGVTSFDQMTNFSRSLRSSLSATFSFYPLTITKEQYSSDGTLKFLFQLIDNEYVEAVIIPTPKRLTACISSQVGCSLTCKFCATGKLNQVRNLTAAEIYDQVALMNVKALNHYKRQLTNVVYMGMGEPLLNYLPVTQSLKYIGADGLGISKDRITISTAGIVKMIKRLGDDQIKCKLALSLHTVNQTKREKIMPISKTNSLSNLLDALKYYYQKVKRIITLEYILFKDFNDSLEDARDLYKFSRQIPSKINLIKYNTISHGSFYNSSPEVWQNFIDYLRANNLNVHIRQSRGNDINSACGQLANTLKPGLETSTAV